MRFSFDEKKPNNQNLFLKKKLSDIMETGGENVDPLAGTEDPIFENGSE